MNSTKIANLKLALHYVKNKFISIKDKFISIKDTFISINSFHYDDHAQTFIEGFKKNTELDKTPIRKSSRYF